MTEATFVRLGASCSGTFHFCEQSWLELEKLYLLEVQPENNPNNETLTRTIRCFIPYGPQRKTSWMNRAARALVQVTTCDNPLIVMIQMNAVADKWSVPIGPSIKSDEGHLNNSYLP